MAKKVIRLEIPFATPTAWFDLGTKPKVLMVSESLEPSHGLVVWVEMYVYNDLSILYSQPQTQISVFTTGEPIADELKYVSSMLTSLNVAYHIYWKKV